MAMPTIYAVLVHVSDVERAAAWYAQVFPEAVPTVPSDSCMRGFSIGDVQLELVPADEKCSSGAAGSVVYWAVADLKEVLGRLASLGVTPYRGPMKIESNHGMAQVRDPWGNCIGLRGRFG